MEISNPYIEIFSIIQKYADVYDANDGGTRRWMHFLVEKGEGTFASLEFQRYRSRILQLFDVYVSSSKIPPISPRLTEAEKKERERNAYFLSAAFRAKE